ncbi:MAG: hypothetical protein KIT79_02030 [Deltaproteobacteria bacterium]|nr:hypothetical protein [Deltaproteobacteria bacterium]
MNQMEQLRLAKKVIFNRARWAQKFFLLVDLDGTLVPAKFDGPAAKLKSSTRQNFADLVALKQTYAGIVSERPLTELAKLFAGVNVHLCGSLGLEYAPPVGLPMHIELTHGSVLLDQVHSDLKKAVSRMKGVKIERLGGFVRVYGLTRESDRTRLGEIIGGRAAMLRIERSKSSIGIVQETGHDKGTAAVAALRRVGFNVQGDICIYFGDDQTDEPVFAALGSFATTVHVGKNEQSKARFFARDIEEVLRFIGELVEVREEGVRGRQDAGARMF